MALNQNVTVHVQFLTKYHLFLARCPLLTVFILQVILKNVFPGQDTLNNTLR